MTFERTTSDNETFLSLVALLDEDLAIRDGEDHAFYAQFDTLDHIKNVVVGHHRNHAGGCGAVIVGFESTATNNIIILVANYDILKVLQGVELSIKRMIFPISNS